MGVPVVAVPVVVGTIIALVTIKYRVGLSTERKKKRIVSRTTLSAERILFYVEAY
jgi:hypothetical protein